jgi:hypothetical protein
VEEPSNAQLDYIMNVINKTLTTSTGENIHIFDGVFDVDELYRMHYYAGNSLFHTKGTSIGIYESKKDFFLRSSFTEQDVYNFGIFESPNFKKLVTDYDIQFKPVNWWMVLSTHLSEYTYHPDNSHKGNKSLLYYINPIWEKNWGGETLFCNRHGEVEIATEFKPGRIVIFDNHILHRPAPLTLSSIPYRFTFVATEGNKIN